MPPAAFEMPYLTFGVPTTPRPAARPAERVRLHHPAPAGRPVQYSLAHERGSARQALDPQKQSISHYAAAPVHFTRPEKGSRRLAVTCPVCKQVVTVVVRSQGAVRWERWKRAFYLAVTGLAFYGFAVLIPWSRWFGETGQGCLGIVGLFAFGAVALYNGARIIAPEAALLVDLAAIPLLEMLPLIGGKGSHTILRR